MKIDLTKIEGKYNLHTHTIYCDGNNTPEEIVTTAIKKGFSSIGFSGHGYSSNDADFCMSVADTKKYCKDVMEAKDKYASQIKVYLGIERDYFGDFLKDGPGENFEYDYIIGSLHYVKSGNKLFSIDNTAEIMEKTVKEEFGGNYMEYVKAYYDTIKDIVDKTKGDIVGHFDLITKFNEGNKYFDEDCDVYKKIALSALEQVAKTKPIFEINTGAMARGYRSKPYPADFLIERIKELGCPIILSSDCHNKEFLDFVFDKCRAILE